MPRYCVPVAIEQEYTSYIQGEDDDAIRVIAAATRIPIPWTGDWTFEVTSGPSLDPIGDGHREGTRQSRLRIGTRSTNFLSIRADNPAKAVEEARKIAGCRWGDVEFVFPEAYWTEVGNERNVDVGEPERDDGPIRARTKFDVDLRRIIAPNASMHPLETDQAFEALRWMVTTSANYEQRCSYHTQKVWHLLAGERSGGVEDGVPMIVSEKDLKSRIVHGVLGLGYDIYDQWREDFGIHPTSRITIQTPHHGTNTDRFDHGVRPWKGNYDGSLDKALWQLMKSLPGMRLGVQLNRCHPGAVIIDSFGVVVHPKGFVFRLRYGYQGSSWSKDLARTRGGETFVETLARAVFLIKSLVPDYQAQIDARTSRSNAPVQTGGNEPAGN